MMRVIPLEGVGRVPPNHQTTPMAEAMVDDYITLMAEATADPMIEEEALSEPKLPMA
jgi:hypothetical protein